MAFDSITEKFVVRTAPSQQLTTTFRQIHFQLLLTTQSLVANSKHSMRTVLSSASHSFREDMRTRELFTSLGQSSVSLSQA